MKSQNLNLKNLYQLPWSKYNNPIGWIEPTTYCQLNCPGCYRGLDQKNPKRIHEDFKKLKKDIDTLIKIRKIKILSIAGGEPLLYPKLEKLLKYANSKDLKIRLVTNGLNLTKKKLEVLKKLGVTEISIHIADYQNRGKLKGEKEVNLLREKYCKIFAEVRGLELNFMITVSKNNLYQINDVLDFVKNKAGLVHRMLFIVYSELFPEKSKVKNPKDLVFRKIVQVITKNLNCQPCAYLGKKIDQKNPSWLFFAPIFLGDKIIGNIDGKTVEKINQREKNQKRWISLLTPNTLSNILKTLTAISHPVLSKITLNYILQLFKNPTYLFRLPKPQIIIIINTPTKKAKGWDLCDGCPDAILYQDKLVPSCLLERIKQGEAIEL